MEWKENILEYVERKEVINTCGIDNYLSIIDAIDTVNDEDLLFMNGENDIIKIIKDEIVTNYENQFWESIENRSNNLKKKYLDIKSKGNNTLSTKIYLKSQILFLKNLYYKFRLFKK